MTSSGAEFDSAREAVENLDRPKWIDVYGRFDTMETITSQPIVGLEKESGHIRAEIVEFVGRLVAAGRPIAPLLLPGEPRRVVQAYVDWLGIDPEQVVTAGLGEDVDVRWNYEDDAKLELRFSLIVSQAMIEHLIDPFKHVTDLFSLLVEGGTLIVHTVTPGFDYHRFPVDCFRFYPDWFEEVAKRMGAEVTGRFVGELRILYEFRKPG